MNAIAFKKTLANLQAKETLIILAVSIIIPFIVHLFPSFKGVPLGARVLAMFYAPFIAIMLYRTHVAVITALFSPFLNSLLTSHPTKEMAIILTIELLIFTIISSLIKRRKSSFWLNAPLAFIGSVVIVSFLLTIIPGFLEAGGVTFFLKAVGNAPLGLLILTFINIFLLKIQPR